MNTCKIDFKAFTSFTGHFEDFFPDFTLMALSFSYATADKNAKKFQKL